MSIPSGEDLKLTTGSGLNLDLGVHATWQFNRSEDIRPRLDLLTFSGGHQDALTPLVQHLDTKVQGLSLGTEFLYHVGDSSRVEPRNGPWAVGAGVYLIRWSVDSTNQVGLPGAGSTQASGTRHWTRMGYGLVSSYRLTPRLEAEARWIASHYGYENLPARFGTIGLLWHF